MLSAIQQFFTDLWDSLTQTMSNPDMAAQLVQPISGLLQLLTPLLALFILIRCGRSLLRGKIEEEVWGYLVTADQTAYPLPHWENLIGRSSRCDVVLNFPTVSRSHAALIRDNAGQWQLHPLNAKNGVLLNGAPITEPEPVQDGDLFDMGGLVLAFLPANEEELHAQAQRRTKPGRFISPGVTLFLLTLFQATLCFKLLLSYQGKADAPPILPCFGVLAGSMWFLYLLYRILKRRGFEIETIAFFLTTLCLTITANGIPKSLAKQTVCVVLGLVVFFSMSLMLRNLELAKWFRWPAAAFSMALLAFNVLFGVRLFGAKNWVSIGPIQFQPSELVKIAFILVGAATLDRMFAKRNLIFTLVFSAFCVGCLGLMSDFGTALIFFVAFLAIAFLRSGDLASVLLMTAAAFFGGYIILKFKTYIAARFLIYRHVWTESGQLRLSADPHHVRLGQRRSVRPGRGQWVVEECGRGQHRPGVRRHRRGNGADPGGLLCHRHPAPGSFRREGSGYRPQLLLRHRRLLYRHDLCGAGHAQRLWLHRPVAVDRRHLPLRVLRRQQYDLLLGAAGLYQGIGHQAELGVGGEAAQTGAPPPWGGAAAGAASGVRAACGHS